MEVKTENNSLDSGSAWQFEGPLASFSLPQGIAADSLLTHSRIAKIAVYEPNQEEHKPFSAKLDIWEGRELRNSCMRIVTPTLDSTGENIGVGKDSIFVKPVESDEINKASLSFPVNSDNFAYLNILYHGTQAVRYFESLDFKVSEPIIAVVDLEANSKVARANPDYISLASVKQQKGGEGDLRDPEDWIREPEAIYHETFHNLLYHFFEGMSQDMSCHGFRSMEAGSLHEALADFFTASITSIPGSIRDLNRCPRQIAREPHSIGHVWGHELWRYRKELIGKGLTGLEVNKIVLNSLREGFSEKGSSTEQCIKSFLNAVEANTPKEIDLNFSHLFRLMRLPVKELC